MRIIAKATLRRFWERHANAEEPLLVWYGQVKVSDWRTPQDIKWMYGRNVDFVGDNRVIFDIGGNKYRLVAHVNYQLGRVLIKFIGTHSEYDRIDPEQV